MVTSLNKTKGYRIEYKIIICHRNNKITWEDGENRKVIVNYQK
jgi:hypothetical protein